VGGGASDADGGEGSASTAQGGASGEIAALSEQLAQLSEAQARMADTLAQLLRGGGVGERQSPTARSRSLSSLPLGLPAVESSATAAAAPQPAPAAALDLAQSPRGTAAPRGLASPGLAFPDRRRAPFSSQLMAPASQVQQGASATASGADSSVARTSPSLLLRARKVLAVEAATDLPAAPPAEPPASRSSSKARSGSGARTGPLSGWLHKLGEVDQSWRRRYFELTPHEMRWWGSAAAFGAGDSPAGRLPLAGVASVEACPPRSGSNRFGIRLLPRGTQHGLTSLGLLQRCSLARAIPRALPWRAKPTLLIGGSISRPRARTSGRSGSLPSGRHWRRCCVRDRVRHLERTDRLGAGGAAAYVHVCILRVHDPR